MGDGDPPSKATLLGMQIDELRDQRIKDNKEAAEKNEAERREGDQKLHDRINELERRFSDERVSSAKSLGSAAAGGGSTALLIELAQYLSSLPGV